MKYTRPLLVLSLLACSLSLGSAASIVIQPDSPGTVIVNDGKSEYLDVAAKALVTLTAEACPWKIDASSLNAECPDVLAFNAPFMEFLGAVQFDAFDAGKLPVVDLEPLEKPGIYRHESHRFIQLALTGLAVNYDGAPWRA